MFENGGLGDGLAEQGERAEALGLHSFWLPEHHFGGGAIPSPLLLLSAVASRTRTLKLGTTSFLLPLRHPILSYHAARAFFEPFGVGAAQSAFSSTSIRR